MRLFIAVDVSDDVKDEIAMIQETIGSRDAKVSWVSKRNLHLTLKFLGEITESKAGELKKVLKNIKFKGFSLELGKFGCFPSQEEPRVLWIGVQPDDELRKLANLIDAETLNFSKSDMEFKSHLTFGRVKLVKFKKEFLDKLKAIKVSKIKFKVDSFTLYKSTLTKQGSIYEIVEKYKLE